MDPIRRHVDPAIQAEVVNIYRVFTTIFAVLGIESVDVLPSDPELGKEVWYRTDSTWRKWNGTTWTQIWPAVFS